MVKRQRNKEHFVDVKNHSVDVIAEDVDNHPICLHGPTLLFSSDKGRFFACSCCRNNKECRIHITEDEWQNDNVKKRNKKYLNLAETLDRASCYSNFLKVKSKLSIHRCYCMTCDILFSQDESDLTKLHTSHNVRQLLTDEQLVKPSTWLPTLESNTREAQYLFTSKSVNLILSMLRNNDISKVLCVGAPRIHEAIQSSHGDKISSLLLDLDKRHRHFYTDKQFLWYNMFNHHFFEGIEAMKTFKKFLKCASGKLCIVTDPPFGGRVEAIAHTFKLISAVYNNANGYETRELIPIVWVFPYFSEPYIRNSLPELVMNDYQVEYENHSKFQTNTKSSRKHGSPVRIFTNLPQSSIVPPAEDGYKYCNECDQWVAETNSHCTHCQSCTSKNGMRYVHCDICKRCVKPTFFHCETCSRCCQQRNHVCGVVLPVQICYNCKEKGHKQSDCPQAKNEVSVNIDNALKSKRKKK